jgi:hypothetical protein
MENPGQPRIDALLKTFAIAVLIASLILAGRNTPPNNDKPPVTTPVHSIKSHHLQTGNA